MSARDESEPEQGGFRASANEDPHGTRAIAMALSEQERARLEVDRTPQRFMAVALACVAALASTALILVPLLGADAAMPIAFGVGMIAFMGTSAVTVRSRMRPQAGELVIVDVHQQERSFAWKQVESFRVEGHDVHAQVRTGAALQGYRGSVAGTTLPVVGGQAPQWLRPRIRPIGRESTTREGERPRTEHAPQWIPSEERELAKGARATVAMSFGLRHRVSDRAGVER